MNFKVIPPPPQLADYVKFFWFSEGSASTHHPFVHHAFAYPCPEFIFCYKGAFEYKSSIEADRKLFSGIYGQTQTFSKVTAKTAFGTFGFYVYPHALPQLFCLPASEISNQSADIKTFCGKEGEILEEKIMLAADNNERVKLACDFLAARLKHARKEHTNIISSIKMIASPYRSPSVKTFAEDNFLSVRQFERRFKALSGFSPKLFLRITRFNSVLNRSFQDKLLTRIAYESGYFDQSHLIHDFQKFSGYNPKEYFKEETKAATDRGTVEFEM